MSCSPDQFRALPLPALLDSYHVLPTLASTTTCHSALRACLPLPLRRGRAAGSPCVFKRRRGAPTSVRRVCVVGWSRTRCLDRDRKTTWSKCCARRSRSLGIASWSPPFAGPQAGTPISASARAALPSAPRSRRSMPARPWQMISKSAGSGLCWLRFLSRHRSPVTLPASDTRQTPPTSHLRLLPKAEARSFEVG